MNFDELWAICQHYRIQQKQKEFSWLLDKLLAIPEYTGIGIDIGTCYGGSTAGLSFICKNLYTIDCGPININRDRFCRGCKYTYIEGNSHTPQTKERLIAAMDGKQADFLFIDGDHSYAGSKNDYEIYSDLVRPGGIIGLHDILFHPNGGSEVDKLWNDIKNQAIHIDEITEEPLSWGGIGIVWKS